MDQAAGWFESFARMLESALQHGAALSIVLGYIVALGLTQYVKQWPIYPTNRWWIRALALPFGWTTTFLAWPIHGWNAVRFFIALAVGVSAPWLYQIITYFLRKRYPDFTARLSAQAPTKSCQNNDFQGEQL